jgi:ribose-phosphate pyrophosphokinase
VGSARLAGSYAKRLDAELVLVDKRRPQHNVAEILHVIGDVAGKDAVIVDDIIDTAGTLVHCAEALVRAGARRVIGACTHAVLSGNAIERIEQSDAIAYVYVTDTIPLRRSSPKLRVISVAQLFAEAILRTHQNTSISSLFEIVR